MNPEIEERFTSLENCQPFQLATYSGIYFLCQGATVVYVGKTKNIARRVAAHLLSNKDFDAIMVMQVPEEFLSSVEMHWIRRLRPVLNRTERSHNSPSPGRRTTGKITVVVRMLPETKTRVEKAVSEFNLDSTSEYVEKAILAQLKKDGIE